MSALYLKNLGEKTWRGQSGRVRAGKSGGGNCYGYDLVRRSSNADEPERGDRCINEKEAAIVSYIFNEYAAGKSPKAIAHALNKKKIPGPTDKAWGPSTINGNWRRGTGILNNELFTEDCFRKPCRRPAYQGLGASANDQSNGIEARANATTSVIATTDLLRPRKRAKRTSVRACRAL
jgi:Recombinase